MRCREVGSVGRVPALDEADDVVDDGGHGVAVVQARPQWLTAEVTVGRLGDDLRT
jgi:hypothetical protein